jgi:UDP-N-acetylmuramoyl-tripeptide--D-alanyl-D-alanine ligase
MMKTALLHQGHFRLQNIRVSELPSVSIDTRTLKQGELFCALKGERFDGHRFIKTAFEKGALAAIVDEEYAKAADPSESLIIVPDTLKGLQEMASIHAGHIKMPVLAITGSAGKTSTRRLLRHVLSATMKVAESPGNFNNHIGLPLTVLRIRGDEDIAVLEMGTSHPGEIRDLCGIIRPDYGLITSIGHAHMSGMGSIENVQKAKFELFDAVPSQGTLFINQNDPRIRNYSGKKRHRIIRYGIDCPAHFSAKLLKPNSLGCYSLGIENQTIRLRTPGPGAVRNALAAYTVARTLNMDRKLVAKMIEEYQPEPGRGYMEDWQGILLIDDSYNANPLSMKNALETLKHIRNEGRKILVFADMLEMGDESPRSHAAVAELAMDAGVEALFCYGQESLHTLSRSMQLGMDFAEHFSSKQELGKFLRINAKPGDVILFKASRGMAIEEVIQIMKGQ